MNIDEQDWEEYFEKQSWPTRVRKAVEGATVPVIEWVKRHNIHTHHGPHFILLGLLVLALYALLLASPLNFPDSALIKVKKGATVDEVAATLAEKNIVHSAFLFKVFAQMYGGVVAGEYAFSEKESVIKVAARLSSGDYQLTPVRITVWDGATVVEITKLLSEKLADFDSEAFYHLAIVEEGKLFPDTYFFYPGDEPDLVLGTMLDNFERQIRSVEVSLALARFGKPLQEVLTMASLLEREAADMQNRRIIAGLLWNRIEEGMLLQVDAAFLYINGKNTFELTKADLAENDPYNTYKNLGLPPGPIGNPSLDAIIAAATPIETDYVFYLSDRTGILHYSKTHDEHVRLKARYLD